MGLRQGLWLRKFPTDLTSELTQNSLIITVPPLTAGGVRNGQVGFAPLVDGVGSLVGYCEEVASDSAARDKKSVGSRQLDPILQVLNQQALDLAGRGPVVAVHRTRLPERFELAEQDCVECSSDRAQICCRLHGKLADVHDAESPQAIINCGILKHLPEGAAIRVFRNIHYRSESLRDVCAALSSERVAAADFDGVWRLEKQDDIWSVGFATSDVVDNVWGEARQVGTVVAFAPVVCLKQCVEEAQSDVLYFGP